MGAVKRSAERCLPHFLKTFLPLLALLAAAAPTVPQPTNPPPLKITLTTPTTLLQPSAAGAQTPQPIPLSGRQAITAVFSRPVVPLGSDFGAAEDFGGVAPFNLSCNSLQPLPGSRRWVTTNIARFTPAIAWPSDLSCTLQWNESLTSWDGGRLELGGAPAAVALATPPLNITLADVTSRLAEQLTDGNWNGSIGKAAHRGR